MFNNSYNNSDVEIISKYKDGSVVVCLENMGEQIVTLTADQAEVSLILNMINIMPTTETPDTMYPWMLMILTTS